VDIISAVGIATVSVMRAGTSHVLHALAVSAIRSKPNGNMKTFTSRLSGGLIPSSEERGLRPLHLLQSLFSDHLSFLQSALDELESPKKERQRLVRYALNEVDSDIQDADVSLSTLKAALNYTERRRHLERRLFELKRERRREALLNWRDLIWLKGEIRKLQSEIDTLNRTAGSAENQEAPK
jgi:DNA repair exonuclease SbcCD ATPase subunit